MSHFSFISIGCYGFLTGSSCSGGKQALGADLLRGNKTLGLPSVGVGLPLKTEIEEIQRVEDCPWTLAFTLVWLIAGKGAV